MKIGASITKTPAGGRKYKLGALGAIRQCLGRFDLEARLAVSLGVFDVQAVGRQHGRFRRVSSVGRRLVRFRRGGSVANVHDENLPFQFFKTDFTFSPTIRCFKSELRVISGCRSERPPYPRPEDFSIKL